LLLAFGYLNGYSLLNLFNLNVDWLAELTAYPGKAYLITGEDFRSNFCYFFWTNLIGL
jgi:hypothetical protein